MLIKIKRNKIVQWDRECDRWYSLSFFIICGVLLYACTQENPHEIQQIKDKTLILYVTASNNLEREAYNLFNQVKNISSNINTKTNNIILLFNTKSETKLYSITSDSLQCLCNYGNVNSISPTFIGKILYDVVKNYPAKEMGVIFWSHGTGWLPTGNTRSFGDDNGEAIDITVLSQCIPQKFEYIIFDACYMGGVEVLADLYEKCNYYVSSPESVPSNGIIDAQSLHVILQNELLEKRLIEISRLFSNKTNHQVSISVIKTFSFPQIVKAINESKSKFCDIDINDIYIYKFRENRIFYDFRSVLEKLVNDKTLINEFIIYSNSQLGSDTNKSGFSVFIPELRNINYHSYYSETTWNELTNWMARWKYM